MACYGNTLTWYCCAKSGLTLAEPSEPVFIRARLSASLPSLVQYSSSNTVDLNSLCLFVSFLRDMAWGIAKVATDSTYSSLTGARFNQASNYCRALSYERMKNSDIFRSRMREYFTVDRNTRSRFYGSP